MSTVHHSQSKSDTSHINSHPIPIIVTVILIFFFIGFFSIYVCRCFTGYVTNANWLFRRTSSGNAVGQRVSSRHGLDPSIVSSFPTFMYSVVKHLQQDKTGLECAVCLSEFEDNDVLRLLTICSHAFHPECIDLWFESHTTCPVCRRNLNPSDKSPDKSPEISFTMPETDEREDEPGDCSHRISVKDDDEERGDRNEGVTADIEGGVGGHTAVEKFPRSHSTGHSIVGGDDRFMLRLPKNVKEQLTRGHSSAGSCITFGDFSGNITVGKAGLDELSGYSSGNVARV